MRHRIAKLVLLVFLGAIVNIAVAWGCATSFDPLSRSRYQIAAELSEDRYTSWEIAVKRDFGSVYVVSLHLRHVIPHNDQLVRGDTSQVVPHWGEFESSHSSFGSGGYAYDNRYSMGAGWPFLSLWCDLNRRVSGERYYERWSNGALASPLPPRSVSLWQRALPLWPIWPGFLANTVVYGAFLSLLFTATATIRRRLRIHRNLCPTCAYPAGNSAVCSECGAAVKPTTIEQQA